MEGRMVGKLASRGRRMLQMLNDLCKNSGYKVLKEQQKIEVHGEKPLYKESVRRGRRREVFLLLNKSTCSYILWSTPIIRSKWTIHKSALVTLACYGAL